MSSLRHRHVQKGILKEQGLGYPATTKTLMAASTVALVVLRVLSPALVCLATLSLLFASSPPPPSPSAITRVVVPTVIPRRTLILCLLSLSALTYLLDGLTFVTYAVIDKSWPQNTGIEYNAVLGVLAFAGMAALGAWKDIRGVDGVWSLHRMKLAIATSSAIDLALVVLIAKAIRFNGGCEPLMPIWLLNTELTVYQHVFHLRMRRSPSYSRLSGSLRAQF